MLFCAISSYAQTYYYNVTKTFNENGYIYQCDVRESGMVTLYNKSNTLTYSHQIVKSTGQYYAAPDDYIPLFESDNWTRAKRFAIVNNAFSTSEKQRVQEDDVIISIYISSETGKVLEVTFEFIKHSPYATIPISVYRKIETELKANISYRPTAEGKKLNYILYWWDQTPK